MLKLLLLRFRLELLPPPPELLLAADSEDLTPLELQYITEGQIRIMDIINNYSKD